MEPRYLLVSVFYEPLLRTKHHNLRVKLLGSFVLNKNQTFFSLCCYPQSN